MEKLEDVDILAKEPNEPLVKDEKINDNESQKENKSEAKEKKGGCEFPTAFTILLIIQLAVFLLLYIIPQGKYDKLEYDSKNDQFKITHYNYTNETEEIIPASEDYLKNVSIKVPIENFRNGYIQDPMAIPKTYKRIKGKTVNFLNLFYYPILGLVDSANISFFLMILGGCLNIIGELNALSAGIKALMKLTKGKEFLLLSIIYVICTIATSTYGMAEETFAFYPILIPICLKSGIDPMIVIGALYISINVGNMFSTFNPFSIVVASYSSGISFLKGIVFRVIGLVIVDVLTIIYFYIYYRKIKLDEQKSIVYDIKKELEDKFLKEENENGNNNDMNLDRISKQIEKEQFTLKQKFVLFLFFGSIIGLVLGVLLLNWSFEHMGSIFLVLALILMFILGKKESEAVKIFMKGVSDFAEFAIILGLSFGINIALDKGEVSDTILYGLTYITNGLPRVIFAILMFIIFIFLGFLFTGWTTLAILAMPVVAPLADEANVPRTLAINSFLFGQSWIQIISPSAYTLIVVELAGVKFIHWLKFVFPYLIGLFVLLIIMLIINIWL